MLTTNLVILFCADDMASIFFFDDIIKSVHAVTLANRGHGKKNLGRSDACSRGAINGQSADASNQPTSAELVEAPLTIVVVPAEPIP